MAGNVFKPYFSWGVGGNFQPGEPYRTYHEARRVRRNDTITGTGKKFSQYQGASRVITVSWDWITDAQITTWETFWDAVKDGTPFVYHDDDSYSRCNDGTVCNDGSTCGGLNTNGATDNVYSVTTEDAQFAPEQMELYGYNSVTMTMRQVV